MLSVGWFVVAVAVAVLLTGWVTFTLTRLDRLHARVDAAWAALDAQLVRRAAAVLGAAESSGLGADARAGYEQVAHTALNPIGATDSTDPAVGGMHGSDAGVARQEAENAVGRALAHLISVPGLRPEARDELHETANRVLIARRFYNDAVRDTRTLRARRMPRLLRLAGRRAMPQFFDIDDTVPVAPVGSPAPNPAGPAPGDPSASVPAEHHPVPDTALPVPDPAKEVP